MLSIYVMLVVSNVSCIDASFKWDTHNNFLYLLSPSTYIYTNINNHNSNNNKRTTDNRNIYDPLCGRSLLLRFQSFLLYTYAQNCFSVCVCVCLCVGSNNYANMFAANSLNSSRSTCRCKPHQICLKVANSQSSRVGVSWVIEILWFYSWDWALNARA